LVTTNATLSAIALGSNLGDFRATLEGALIKLDQTSGIIVKSRSSWYKTAPVGPSQPDYLNGCALLETESLYFSAFSRNCSKLDRASLQIESF